MIHKNVWVGYTKKRNDSLRVGLGSTVFSICELKLKVKPPIGSLTQVICIQGGISDANING